MTEYQTPEFGLDIDVPDPERFTLEHWLYLTRSVGAPEVPMELAPLPMPLRTDEQLRRTLAEWELIESGGTPIPALAAMMKSLTDYRLAVWGHARFPRRAHHRTLDLPPEARDWGLDGERLVVPLVPFLIAVGDDDVIVAATSDEDGLIVERYEGTSATPGDIATVLRDVIDPERQWPPKKMGTLRVPAELLTELEETGKGSLAEEVDPDERARGLVESAAEHQIGRDTALELSALIGEQPAAMVQFTATVRKETGMISREESAAATIIFVSGEEPSAVVGYPARDYLGNMTVIYQGADDENVTEAVASVLQEARFAARTGH